MVEKKKIQKWLLGQNVIERKCSAYAGVIMEPFPSPRTLSL
jgi:hypothetical protein